MRQALQGLHQTEKDIAPALLKKTWQMWRVLQGLEERKHFGLIVTQWNRPGPTITKDAGGATSTIGIIHPTDKRRLTIPEIRRLASFPDAFQFPGTFADQWARIGNTVPPLFMQAVAEHIYETFLQPVKEEKNA